MSGFGMFAVNGGMILRWFVSLCRGELNEVNVFERKNFLSFVHRSVSQSLTRCVTTFAVWLHSASWLAATSSSLDVHLRKLAHKPIKRSFSVRGWIKRHASHLLRELIQHGRAIRTSSPDRRTCGLAGSKSGVAPHECWRCSNSTYCAEFSAVCDVTCRNGGCTTCLADSVCGWVGVAMAEEGAEDEEYRFEPQKAHSCDV